MPKLHQKCSYWNCRIKIGKKFGPKITPNFFLSTDKFWLHSTHWVISGMRQLIKEKKTKKIPLSPATSIIIWQPFFSLSFYFFLCSTNTSKRTINTFESFILPPLNMHDTQIESLNEITIFLKKKIFAA